MNDKDRPLYMISVAAELAGVHPQTLRIYEQKGLVSPKRTGGNTRMYSQSDIDRLQLINDLTSEGINLAGVIRIIDLQTNLEKCNNEIKSLHNRIHRLADRVHELENRENVNAIFSSCTSIELRKSSNSTKITSNTTVTTLNKDNKHYATSSNN